MKKDTMKDTAFAADPLLYDDWFDAIADGVRARGRGFMETMLEEEFSGTLSPAHGGANRMRRANRRRSPAAGTAIGSAL